MIDKILYSGRTPVTENMNIERTGTSHSSETYTNNETLNISQVHFYQNPNTDEEQSSSYPVALVQQDVSSMELMARCVNQEVMILRLWIRTLGLRIRAVFETFYNNTLNASRRHLRRMVLRYSSLEPITYEGDAAMIFTEDTRQIEEKIPKYSFNNIEEILTTDDNEEGIIHRNPYLFPKWRMLPLRAKSEPVLRDDISEFQLFNKPLSVTMTLEDDDDLMSIGSTRTGVAETLQSMEAQVAMLTKQLQYFMSIKNNEKDTSPERSSMTSDDEGKGGSLCSPTMGGKIKVKSVDSPLRSIAVPTTIFSAPPPPPPLPPNLLKPVNQEILKPKVVQEAVEKLRDENRNPDGQEEDREAVVRPSVSDLRTVRLKKTNTDRSPGGTPLPRGRRNSYIPSADLDQGAFLGAALRAKFRTMQENSSFSEQEDDNSSLWVDEDGDS
ncbi:unnamed protein product [Auanema sp. JU1783]|nr:unnamed protein product [Auanema sp. JU1783]